MVSVLTTVIRKKQNKVGALVGDDGAIMMMMSALCNAMFLIGGWCLSQFSPVP